MGPPGKCLNQGARGIEQRAGDDHVGYSPKTLTVEQTAGRVAPLLAGGSSRDAAISWLDPRPLNDAINNAPVPGS